MKSQILVHVYRELLGNSKISQQKLAEKCRLSVGTINRAIQYGREQSHLEDRDGHVNVTESGLDFLENFRVKNAIILAAGFGSRCVPLTYETPKGLLKVKGKPMMERQIEQLKEKGIDEIIIVVGYLKEAFDYLVDQFGVTLVYNPDFATKNNLASLYHVSSYLDNSYVLVADNWIEENIFNMYEAESWFSCLYFDGPTDEWCAELAPSGLIKKITIGGENSYAIVGPAFFSSSFSEKFKQYLGEYYPESKAVDYYWEHILRDHIKDLPMYANPQTGNVYEFENLAELREYDKTYIHDTQNKIMEHIANNHGVRQGDIHDIVPLKDGVTNKSFKFAINGDEFVFRLPGYGTDKLINRANEKATYVALGPIDISDEIVSFDEHSGIKISRYYPNSCIADPFHDEDLRVSMEKIKKVHEMELKVGHSVDIANMIEYYFSLAEGIDAIHFADIDQVRDKVALLLKLKEKLAIPEILCHGDYAHTNVLKLENGEVRLIDWEYSGMADPIMDVSMYAIYAQFDRARIELSLDYYLGRKPTPQEQVRLYLYVALGGFLWSMWSEYKQGLGQEFGEYPMIMYRYMKDYFNILEDMGVMNLVDE